MVVSRQGSSVNSNPGRGGSTPDKDGGSNHVSPFIRRDRYKRNFLKARQGLQNSPKPMVKKLDPDQLEAKEKKLLGVENGIANIKNENGSIGNNEESDFNEFPLRAITEENLENMRTHLLKFQSKKKIEPSDSFHLPVRLHRKDTRNLQFQLTRAEIVQRQKEIAQFKVKQEEEKTSLLNGNSKPKITSSSTTSAGNSASPVSVVNGNFVTQSQTSIQDTPDATPIKPEDSKENEINGDKPNAIIPMVTQLEEAGISEHPENVGMVRYDGKEESELGYEPGTTDPMADVAPDGGGRARRINPKRKTRQLKILDENAKKLRFEEFYPWVMEDYDGYNTWVGSYEAGNSDSYVLLAVENDGSFTMIPADKVYKFTARNKYATLTIDEAEKRMDKKSGEVPRWLMKHLDNIGTTTTRYDRTKRKLKAVADQRDVVGDDSEEHDDNSEVELDYDEEFADDEEAPIIDGNEQENKESEQRIKKEMLQANAMGLRDNAEIPEDEEDDLFNDKKIDVEGERIKKALQKTELAALYSSDEDDLNPYLSESDLEKEDKPEIKKEDNEKVNSPEAGDSMPIKREYGNANKLPPRIRVKNIKGCIVVLKGDKDILMNFQPGEWNPTTAMKRSRTINDEDGSPTDATETEGPSTKKVKLEETNSVALITEQDIIEAMGDGRVNVKDFGKMIRKNYPGPQNKKLMFAIVKKLCRKVDNEHMELKK